MNEDLVYSMIKPYVRDDTLSYKDFYRLFDVLRKNEQYQIINLIEDKFNIRLVDPLEESDLDVSDLEDEEFEVLYDKGVFANDCLSECKDMDYRQANEILCGMIQDGNEAAKEALCIKNKRLVYKYAFAYNKYYGNKLDIEDLAQAGYIGLIKGAERFDISRGNTFSTYVTYWVKQSITRELIDKGFTIRIPVHLFEQINKLIKIDNKYDAQGYDFSERVSFIASEMGITKEKVLDLFTIKQQYLSISSLDTPVGEAEETPLLEFIEDEDAEMPDSMVTQASFREALEKDLKMLTPKEAKVVRERTGFDDGIPKTLEEVGKMLGVTRERIRQIENKACRKMHVRLNEDDYKAFFER